MPQKINFPSKLKESANPTEAFNALADLGRDLPGARAWGTAERGFVVNLGAGFDFGPVLTCGAPVITAEVGAQVSIGGAQNLVTLLDRDLEGKYSLSKLSGWSVSLKALLEAKAGVGIPESWAEAAAAMVPEVPTRGVKETIEANTVGNPLAPEEEEPEEPEALPELNSEKQLPLGQTILNDGELNNGTLTDASDPAPLEDVYDIALESLQADDTTNASKEDSPADLVDDSTTPESADKIIDASAMLKGELTAGVRYLIVRDPSPERHDSLAGVEDAMKAFISNSTKAVLKQEIEEFLNEHTADSATAGKQGTVDKIRGRTAGAVERALNWMSLFPARNQDGTWTSLNNRLLACKALDPVTILALQKRLEEVYVLTPKQRPLKLQDLLDFGSKIVKGTKERDPKDNQSGMPFWNIKLLFPSATDYTKAKKYLEEYEDLGKPPWGKKNKADWKSKTFNLLKDIYKTTTPKSVELHNYLMKTIRAGENSYYGSNAAPMTGEIPLYDQVVDLRGSCNTLSLMFSGSDGLIIAEIETKTQNVLEEFRNFLKVNAGKVPNPPDSRLIGKRSTAELVAKLDEILTKNPDLEEAKKLSDALTKLKNSERTEVKNRAVALLAKAGNAKHLSSWPKTPSTRSLVTTIWGSKPSTSSNGATFKAGVGNDPATLTFTSAPTGCTGVTIGDYVMVNDLPTTSSSPPPNLSKCGIYKRSKATNNWVLERSNDGSVEQQLIDDLFAIADAKEQDNALDNDPASNLTYISMLGFSGGGATSAVAKAKARFGLGINELGIHAKAVAEAQFSTEAINVRTQGFTGQPAAPGGTVSAYDLSTVLVQTQDVKIRRWAASAEAAAELKLNNKTVAETGKALKESGRIRWSGATGRWKLPVKSNAIDTKAKRVGLKMGSGVCFGRSAGRERFSEKMKALREQNTEFLLQLSGKSSKSPKITPYVKRLAGALRVNPKALAKCLLQLFPKPEDESVLSEHDILYFESRWSVPGSSDPSRGFKLRSPSKKQQFLIAVQTAVGYTSDKPAPPPEINDLRKSLVPQFKNYMQGSGDKSKTKFKLQSIAIRVRLGDEPEENEKTLFQFGHEYIVMAMASVVKREATRALSMPDAVVWWANPKFRKIEAKGSQTEKEFLYKQAVPPLFLLDV